MGLAEKRIAKEFQDKQLPMFTKSIAEAAGFSVPVEVKWEQLTPDGESHLFLEHWPKIYFEPLVEALKSITRDDLGKEALKGALKKVVIRNEASCSTAAYMAQFENGTLTLDHQPTTNIGDYDDRVKYITETLEKAL